MTVSGSHLAICLNAEYCGVHLSYLSHMFAPVCESYFQTAILEPTDPFVFECICICGSVGVHTCSRY